ncbi:OmpA family protein [Flavobacteriaceae bacterium 14752]|uniref:OmpA family protein n=1 Tax=Mesohalobacter salilacus TaxID=2491711 RepID=UPI000F635297|nr:OmpA family protein [Flavobacteriaceae bacterium 14752]
MKKLVYLIMLMPLFAVSQEQQNEELSNDEAYQEYEPFEEYDQWFLEFGIGGNKAARTHTGAQPQFLNPSNVTETINTSLISGLHANLAIRYMFNDKFGLRFKGGFNDISEDEDRSTTSFNSTYFQSSLETVFNLGSILDFQNWTNNFNLQFYTGFGAGLLLPDDQFVDDEDLTFSAIAGFTPMFRLSDQVSLKFDFMTAVNFDQDYNWDGISTTTTRAVDGIMFNASVGLNIALGKQKKNIDWYHVYNNEVNEIALLREELNALKQKMTDSDQDGVLDFLDREPGTTNGVAVNTKGIAVDNNQNGVPDELENTLNTKFVSQSEFRDSQSKENASDVIRSLITKGYINVYFGFDSVVPEASSIQDINSIVLFLKQNPSENIELTGYTDPVGNKAYNEKLSNNRAKYINDILVSAGVDQSRIEFKGSGVNPNFENNSEYSRKLSRKVKVQLK